MQHSTRDIIHTRELYPERAVAPFEDMLDRAEANARQSCLEYAQSCKGLPPSPDLAELLEEAIIPALGSIGIEEWLVRQIFSVGGHVWEPLILLKNTRVLLPRLRTQLEKVREGIMAQGRQNHPDPFCKECEAYQGVFTGLRELNASGDIFRYSGNMAVSWIILPRAYRFIRKRDLLILLVYIEKLNEERACAFRRLLARVVTEFLFNFSLKHASPPGARDSLGRMLFWGSAAMFWKNLRFPPRGAESLLVYENFYILAKSICERFGEGEELMEAVLQCMKHVKERVFLDDPLALIQDQRYYDIPRLVVALRHGLPGIQACLRYFAPGPPLLGGKTWVGLPYSHVPKRLHLFLKILQGEWASMELTQKKYAMEFLRVLKMSYLPYTQNSQPEPTQEDLKFLSARIIMMIRTFKEAAASL